MTASCQEFRKAAAAGESHALAAHLSACEDCRDWEQATCDPKLSSLLQLERRGAPRLLDGRVVAAMHAGYRQDRAAEQVSLLARLGAPLELADRLRGTWSPRSSRPAPAELDRRVGELLMAQSRQERSWRRGMHAAVGLLALAAGVWFLTSPGGSSPAAPAAAYSFRVHEIEASELDSWEPSIRGFVSGWTGGLSDTRF